MLEKRVARYLIVSLDATDEVGEPTEGELESFFNETKLRFTEPERRDGSVLLITPERFAETIKISDDEILAEYDLSIDEFSSPERRAIDQLVLNSDEEIEKINSLLDDNRRLPKSSTPPARHLTIPIWPDYPRRFDFKHAGRARILHAGGRD